VTWKWTISFLFSNAAEKAQTQLEPSELVYNIDLLSQRACTRAENDAWTHISWYDLVRQQLLRHEGEIKGIPDEAGRLM
jgi:hypothetical protein